MFSVYLFILINLHISVPQPVAMCSTTISSSCLFVIEDICVVVMALREYVFFIHCSVYIV